jgi:hypothetical protein
LQIFQFWRKGFTGVEVRYRNLCEFLSKEESANTWKHFRTLRNATSVLMALNSFLSYVNCNEDVGLAKAELVDLMT